MKATIKYLLIKYLKPRLYFVENNQYLGDSVEVINTYFLKGLTICYLERATGDERYIDLNKVFVLKSSAKKEAAKSIIPVDEGNYKLVRELQSIGIKLTKYEIQQIIEDGEASEVYQSKLP